MGQCISSKLRDGGKKKWNHMLKKLTIEDRKEAELQLKEQLSELHKEFIVKTITEFMNAYEQQHQSQHLSDPDKIQKLQAITSDLSVSGYISSSSESSLDSLQTRQSLDSLDDSLTLHPVIHTNPEHMTKAKTFVDNQSLSQHVDSEDDSWVMEDNEQ
jgi:hypothetical protein